jgi:hypothetical protein
MSNAMLIRYSAYVSGPGFVIVGPSRRSYKLTGLTYLKKFALSMGRNILKTLRYR